MIKKNYRLLFLLPFLVGCQSYTGPVFYIESDSLHSYTLLDSVASFQETVDQLSDLIFVLGVTTCTHCQNLDRELETYVEKKTYSIYHLYYDQSINDESDCNNLVSVINGEDVFLPTYKDSFYVPIVFIIQGKKAVYAINDDFVSTLGHCIKTT